MATNKLKDIAVQGARGWAAGLAGLPGDLEGLARMAIKYGASPGSYVDRNMSDTPALPTSEFYKEWLPGGDWETPEGALARDAGALLSGAGSTKLAGLAQKYGTAGAKKAVANAMVPSALSKEAGAVLIPSAKRVVENSSNIALDLSKGASRSDIYDQYGTIPVTPGYKDWFDPINIARRDMPPASWGLPSKPKAVPLDYLLRSEDLYKARPDLKDLTVILNSQAGGAADRALGRYFGSTSGNVLPRSGTKEPNAGLEAVIMNLDPGMYSNLLPQWGAPGRYSVLEHELNHALQARAGASRSADPDWSKRIQEVAASIGAVDEPAHSIIRRFDEALPLAQMRPWDYAKFSPPAIGSAKARATARDYFNTLEPNELEEAMRKVSKRAEFAQGGLVSQSNDYDPSKVDALVAQLQAEFA